MISVCMIVKDEAAVLERCLVSVKALADELIVVDTGSKDKTCEIAKSFGARIFSYKWNDSFADARNFALSKATKDWIFMIDADETINKEDIEKIKNATSKESVMGYSLIQRTYTNDSSSPSWRPRGEDTYAESKTFEGWFPTKLIRLFRHLEDVAYVGRVHETIHQSIEAKGGKIEHLDVPLHHYGKVRGDDFTRAKGENYLKLGEKKVSETSKEDKAKAYFELGVQASRLGEHEKAITAFLDTLKENDSYPRARLNLGVCYIKRGKFDDAIAVLEEDIARKPTADLYNNLGIAYEQLKEFEQSIKAYTKALSLDERHIETHENLARIYFQAKQFDKLEIALKNIIGLNPKRLSAYHNLGGIYLQQGRGKEALEVLTQAVKEGISTGETYMNLGMAYKATRNNAQAAQSFKKAASLNPKLEKAAKKLISSISAGESNNTITQ